MKKILIFYASFGGGHLSAANSIKQCIDENFDGYETNLIDCFLYVNKPINKLSTIVYKEMAKKFPWAWGEVYRHSQRGPIAHISSTANNLMAKKLLKLLREYAPDVVISTHPFGSQMVSYLKRKALIDCKLATIMTDFAPHEQCLVGKEQVDYFFVSHEKMRQELIDDNIPAEKVLATGIPISKRFLMNYDRTEVMNSFNLNLNKKVILLFGGGEFGLGREQTLKILKSFITHSTQHQIVAISGKNEKMKESFEKLVEELHSENMVRVLPYTTQVPELMSIADFVVTKPGGLTSTESLVSGLPMVLINPIPGQEEENAKFLEDSGVGIWLKQKENCDGIITELLNNEDKLNQMRKNTELLAKKNSTMDICKTILQAKYFYTYVNGYGDFIDYYKIVIIDKIAMIFIFDYFM